MTIVKKVLILGAGMVGGEIARCLAEDFDVSVVDKNQEALEELSKKANVKTIPEDFSNHAELFGLASAHDIIVGAMPGFLAFEVLKNIIPAGRPVVDISFFNEAPFQLDNLARENNIPVVVDFGVAPGMSNFLLGFETTRMKVEKFACFVGGLPLAKDGLWNYRAPFEVKSIIDEYLRPARFKVNGKIVTKPALTDPEEINFENVGTLEAFNTDGLRTALSLPVPNMVEKTLRYPGYREAVELLIHSGFFSEKYIRMTTELLSKAWKLNSGEKEFTVMRLVMEGESGGKMRHVEYELFDSGDPNTGASSMARVTGYPCAAVVHLFAKDMITETGVMPPEKLGTQEGMADFVLAFLKTKGVNYKRTEQYKV